MKKILNTVFTVILAVAFPFGCISSSYPSFNGYFGFHSLKYTFLRYVIIAVVLIILTVLSRNSYKFLTYYIPICTTIITLVGAFDHFAFGKYLYNYAHLLWFCAAVCVANAAVFIGATISFKEYYEKFYYYFWYAFSLLYFLILRVAFVRDVGTLRRLNLKLFSGTMKFIRSILENPTEDAYTGLVVFGNLLILLPLPFILLSIFRKPHHISMISFGFIIPIIIESLEYFYKSGTADIDDLVLNWTGFIIGYIIMLLIYGRRIKEKAVSLESVR